MTATEAGRLLHTALSYTSPDELAATVGPVIAEWLSADDRVHVNVSADSVDALKSVLGADAGRVRWSDSHSWHPHPARRLRAIQDLVDAEPGGPSAPLRFVGECAFPDGPPELVAEWERFDAVLNEVLRDAAVTMVCAYDVRTVPDEVLDRMQCSHPFLGLEPHRRSSSYLGPGQCLADRRRALAVPPDCAQRVEGRVSPAEARAMVRAMFSGVARGEVPTTGECVDARARRSPSTIADDMAIAATEIVTNAWQCGAARVDVTCWHADGEYSVQVDDDGPGFEDPYAGYRRPPASAVAGRGLWIVRQLADLVEVVPCDPGTTVRARFFEDGAAPA